MAQTRATTPPVVTPTETVVATVDLVVEPGDQAPKGPDGLVGPIGERGDKGPKGPVGPVGQEGD